ncbi:unnamed protein product, partial [Schistosoma bovis]
DSNNKCSIDFLVSHCQYNYPPLKPNRSLERCYSLALSHSATVSHGDDVEHSLLFFINSYALSAG